jgi:lysozyme
MPRYYTTSPEGFEIIERFEGLHRVRRDGLIEAYKIGNDLTTIGIGQTGQMPDGRKVELGLVITKEEAYDALHYFVRNVTEPLVRKHFVAQSQHEFDALVSWVYNVSAARLEAGQYSLPRLVNNKARDIDALIKLWLRYIHTPGFENGLYRRRLAEILLFLGLPWKSPAVWGYISTAIYKRGTVVEPTDPDFIINVAQTAAEAVTQEPDPPSIPKPIAPVEVTPLEPVSPIDPTLPAKKIEESRTGRAVNRASRGRETAGIGGIGAVLVLIAQQIEAIDKSMQGLSPDTVFRVSLFGAFALAGLGIYWWWSGRTEAYHRRQERQDPKY